MIRLRLVAAAALVPLLATSCTDLPSAVREPARTPRGPAMAMYLGISCGQSTLVAGTGMQCYARTFNGTYVSAWWGTSNTSVATVSHGYIYGVAPGTATIYASWSDGYQAYSGTRVVTVVSGAPSQPAVVSQVTVSSAVVEQGTAAQLVARAYDSNGQEITGRTATWSIDDPGIASISSSGVVTGQSLGSTTARATIDGVSGAGTVTVQEYQEPTCGQYLC
jgi:hypothetical protein